MPDTPHPPFVSSATQQPRTLNRWLDVNPQGRPLGRTQTFITLPAFNQAYTWLGYSEIVAAFNFEGPNNFSLKSIAGLVTNPNYLLCISYRVGGVLFRYALWNNVGEVIYFNLPLYTGQIIKKNFRLEIWSTTEGTPVINANAINFYTSVLGIQDYRYGVDGALVNADPIVTQFSTFYNPPGDDVLSGVTDQWLGAGILTNTNWPPTTGTGSFGFIGGGTASVIELSNVYKGMQINNPDGVFTLSGATVQHNYYFVIQPGYLLGDAITIEDNVPVGFDITFSTDVNNNPTVIVGATTIPTNNYIIGIWIAVAGTNVTVTIYDTNGNVLGVGNLVITSFSATKIFFQLSTIFQVIHAANTFDFQSHLQTIYGGFNMPLTFPNNSVSTTN